MSNIIDTKTGKEITHMSCDDYLEHLWNTEGFHTLISELHWGLGVDVDRMFHYMVNEAAKDGVVLTDIDTWDYDKPLYESYKNSDDKGLS